MPRPVHIVLSIPPDGVSDDEYARWYDTHLAEILETPGFAGARRYWLNPSSPVRPPLEYRHAAVYCMDVPSQEPLADLGRRMGDGEMTIPAWFGGIRFASFDGRPLEDVELDPPDHGYLVLSHAPRRFTTDEYYGWYYAHARENLTSEGFEIVWRYGLTAVTADPHAVGRATHAALYKVEGELPALHRALRESAEARRVDIPEWMPEGDFVSWECLAAAPIAR
jgi:hypothetical protein